jgi:hypothetical protein
VTLSTFKKAALVVALVASAAAAQAANYTIGALGNTYSKTVHVAGSFDDTYTFTLPSQFSGVTGSYFAVDWAGTGLSTNLKLGMGAAGSPSALSVDLPLNSTFNDFDVASYQSSFGLTPGGSYWFRLSGSGDAASYTVTLAPVPEPETYALLLAGLGLMGVIGRRRQTK